MSIDWAAMASWVIAICISIVFVSYVHWKFGIWEMMNSIRSVDMKDKQQEREFRSDVQANLDKARKSGRYLIMITYLDPRTSILQHNASTENFPKGDLDASYFEHSKLIKNLK